MTAGKNRPNIRIAQVIASALAAVAAAVIGSQLGVAGTIIGAAVASSVSTVGGAIFLHTFDRTKETVIAKIGPTEPLRVSDLPTDIIPAVDEQPPASGSWRDRISLKLVAIVSGIVFAASILTVTGYELITNKSLSGTSGTTSVGKIFGNGDATSSTTTVTSTVTSTTTATPTNSSSTQSSAPTSSESSSSTPTSSTPTSSSSSSSSSSTPSSSDSAAPSSGEIQPAGN
jgi:hypothetical protein